MKILIYSGCRRSPIGEEPVDFLECVHLHLVGEGLRCRARRLGEPRRVVIAKRREPTRDLGGGDSGGHGATHTVAHRLRAPGDRAGEHGHPGGERLEMHVAEWLVESGESDHVRGGVEPLDVGAWRNPRHGGADAEPGRHLAEFLAPPLAGHEHAHTGVSKGRHCFQQRAEALALEAGADEGHEPGLRGEAEIAPRVLAPPLPVVRVEALEVDPVVDHADPLGRRAVQSLDLRPPALGDGHDVARRSEREDPPLQVQEQTMLRIYLKSTAAHRSEIGSMASLPTARRAARAKESWRSTEGWPSVESRCTATPGAGNWPAVVRRCTSYPPRRASALTMPAVAVSTPP